MSGIFNRNPSKPKYSFIWDVEVVLTYLKSLPIDDSINDKLLTLKLTTILALTSASRASENTNLDIRYLAKSPKVFCFTFSKVSKTWKKGQQAPLIKFFKFDQDERLCVCKTIDQYLRRSKS